MQTVEAQIGRMEAELRRWGAKLHELRTLRDRGSGEANTYFRKRLDDLEAKHEAAQTKLDELKAAGSARWETYKSGIEDAWSELEAAFRKLAN
jgi:hypothetical protein